jgi:hypothetical protein
MTVTNMDSQTQPAPANSKLQKLGHFGGFAAAYLVMPALLGASLALVDARFANVLSNTPRVILQTSGFLSYPAVNL